MVVTLLFLLTQSVTVSAKQDRLIFKASGTIDYYVDAESAEIISGHWSIQVKGEELIYKAMYKELNLDEEIEQSPEGSVDIFTHTLTTDAYELDEDVLTFEGDMQVKKVWTTLDWKKEVQYWDSYVIITVTPDEFFLNSYPHDPDPEGWDREGTTIHFILKE